MDDLHQVHGVDVSWTHRPTLAKEHHYHSSPGLLNDVSPPLSSHSAHPTPQAETPKVPNKVEEEPPKAQAAPQVVSTSPPKAAPVTETTSQTTTPPTAPTKTQTRRPSILNRSASEKQTGTEGARGSRRNSWISSLSSKFSSQPAAAPSTPQTSRSSANGSNAGPPPHTAKDTLSSPARPQEAIEREKEELQPYVPQKPKEVNGSFFSSLTRRLSSNAQAGGLGKAVENGGVCPRRILNVDRTRERCLVAELDLAKLRRVSFSVDVEIASGPRYKDEDSAATKQKKTRDRKVKERAEGEALKHPEAITEAKETKNDVDGSAADDAVANAVNGPDVVHPARPDTENGSKGSGLDEKPQKKVRTEEEKRERKERKRRKAEESGQVPVELTQDLTPSVPDSQASTPMASGTATPRTQDRPTTDPVRIYRRCCQLRESPILKRITEQLMAPNCTMPDEPGVVAELRLSGSRMQLADVLTLSDWLAIVPVKRLLLEDADLNDEGVRVILAGLLAAKKPEPTKRRNGLRIGANRAASNGIIEKLTLKNNPRITKVGWKHIALFLYMCRSIKAVDVSMIQFPRSLPPTNGETETKPPSGGMKTTGHNVDAAEILCKALSERLGGSHLEELTMAECGLGAAQIRKIVDGAVMSGISRLGLAGNRIDDEGFDHILNFVRSGVCHALDLGSNDLRGKLGRLGDALTSKPDCPVWGLSLAGCNLDTASLKEVFPAMIALPDFRFLDLGHNRDLFNGDVCSLQLLRRYLPKLHNLKRLHLRDVGLTVKQAISLAEVLPEGPVLAHIILLDNPQLSALANATDERSQEEACALYASLTAAARVSKSIVCIDIDVPSPDHGEVVKALAKQVVAYCLRNMDRTMSQTLTMPLAATLSKPHGVDDARFVEIPDVLLHLVGNLDGDPRVHDNGDAAPDEDYIVGGNGLVKALQYFLSEEAIELRRGSFPGSGATTPIGRPQQSGPEIKRKGKAKEVSKELLDSARKLRDRLQPALVKEFTSGDEIGYRRLSFLDDTLKGIIERFEDEYPETRPVTTSPQVLASLPSSLESSANFGSLSSAPESMAGSFTSPSMMDMSALSMDSDEEDHSVRIGLGSRKNSDVSLANRALALEEGRIHRLGHKVRQDLLQTTSAEDKPLEASAWAEGSRMSEMVDRMTDTSGPELREILERSGWDGVLENLGANMEELKQLQMKDPVGWEQFKESQLKAFANKKIGAEAERGSAIE